MIVTAVKHWFLMIVNSKSKDKSCEYRHYLKVTKQARDCRPSGGTWATQHWNKGHCLTQFVVIELRPTLSSERGNVRRQFDAPKSLLWFRFAPSVYISLAHFRIVNNLIETLFCVWSGVVKLQKLCYHSKVNGINSLGHKKVPIKSCFW